MTEKNSATNWNTILIQLGLFCVAIISVGCALFHGFHPKLFDDKSATFLAVAVVALVIHQISKFKGFGIEIELEKKVKDLETAFGGLEKTLGPGSKSAVSTAPGEVQTLVRNADPTILDPDDPNKGRFGGSPEANGRKLSATIRPLAGPNSSRCRVNIKVLSTDRARPLEGDVRLHLHPSFGQWSSYEIEAIRGVAQDQIVSYGAFTIGAEADGGQTRLELDLMTVQGGTKRFYEE